ncbi:MAG: aromatic amino acid transporter family, partial [Pseudomonas sp.]|nr:aromatic amino acid transporter family [Pseudomonas sp.]
YSHLKFRQHLDRTGQKPLFKALWYPYGNYLCLAFVVLILGIMLMIPGIKVSVYAIPVWLVVMYGFYLLKSKRGSQSNGAVSSVAE